MCTGGGARASARARACDRRKKWVRVRGARCDGRPRLLCRCRRARPPHVPPQSQPLPPSPRTRWAARGTFVDLELSVARPRGTPRPFPLRRCPGTAPVGKGKWGEGPRDPAIPSLSLDLRSRWRRRGPANERGGQSGPGAGGRRGGRSGVGGTREEGERGEAEGRGTEGSGGEEPRGPRRFRTGKLVLPKSRHPGVRAPLRSGREPPSWAGRRGSPRKGSKPGAKVEREGAPEPERGQRAQRRRDPSRRSEGGRPALRAPERKRRGARAAGETKAPAGALPAAARSGRGGRAAGGRGADTL